MVGIADPDPRRRQSSPDRQRSRPAARVQRRAPVEPHGDRRPPDPHRSRCRVREGRHPLRVGPCPPNHGVVDPERDLHAPHRATVVRPGDRRAQRDPRPAPHGGGRNRDANGYLPGCASAGRGAVREEVVAREDAEKGARRRAVATIAASIGIHPAD
ncbi:hypothetical protein DFJ74DRAFT_664309 [Hyaloraphidium curvatum]|nr:hypothetical protein DFJ74DRAFT_664309 [Hyaloraphidium curvatum]